ncbi:MAG TPA: phage tail tape measure protein, partial [Planctomycetaceae bacterium]|nr:phage tail tape measure protein [Planctomycetaceae bacterium]
MSAQSIRAGRAFVEIYAVDKFSKVFDAAESRLNGFSDALMAAARSAAAPGLSVMAPMAAATMSFAAFDDQMRKVASMAGGTDAELRTLTATAEHLGQTTSYTAAQVAALMVELARGGMNAGQIDQATKSVLALARASDTDAAKAAEILIATMNQFRLSATDAGRISDVLALAANRSAVSVESLGESLKYAGPVAKDLGLSLEETVGMLSQLGNFGIAGSEAGTALRRIGILASTQAEELQALFGVINTDPTGKLRPLVDILDEIGASVSQMGQAEGISALEQAFGILGITSASVISQTGGGVRGLTADLQNAAGVAITTADAMDGGIGGAFRRFVSALEGAINAVGSQLSGPLIQFGQAVARVLVDITGWISQNQTLVVALAAFGAGAMAVSAALVALAVVTQTLLFSLLSLVIVQQLSIWMFGATLSAIAFAGVLRMLGAVSKLSGMILTGMGKAVASSVGIMGAARAGVVAYVAALRGASGSSALLAGTTAAMNAATASSPGIVGLATAAWTLLRGAVTALLSPSTLVTRMATLVASGWKAAGIAIKTTWVTVIAPLLVFAAKAAIVIAVLYGIGRALVGAARQAGSFGTLFSMLGQQFERLLSVVKNTFGGVMAAIKSGEYANAVSVLWMGIKAAFWTGIETVMIGFGYFLSNGLDEVVAFGKSLLSILWNFFTSIPKMLWSALSGGASIASIIADALSGNLDGYSNLFSTVEKKAKDARDAVVSYNAELQKGREMAAILQDQQDRLAEAEAEAAKGDDRDKLDPVARDHYDKTEARISELKAQKENAEAAKERLAALDEETQRLRMGEDAAERHAFALKVSNDATQMAAYDAAIAAQRQAKVSADIKGRIDALNQEAFALKHGEQVAERYAFSLAGATAAQLKALKMAQQAEADAQKQDQLKQDGMALTEAMRTPLEVFRDGMRGIAEMRGAGAIDDTTFGRARDKAFDEFFKSAE